LNTDSEVVKILLYNYKAHEKQIEN